MSNLIKNDNINGENGFEQIFFHVQNQIELFERESLSIWKGFQNLQKIHGDIIQSFQTLGDAYLSLVSRNKVLKRSAGISSEDEIVPPSPVKKKSKKKHSIGKKCEDDKKQEDWSLQNFDSDETYCEWAEKSKESVKNDVSSLPSSNCNKKKLEEVPITDDATPEKETNFLTDDNQEDIQSTSLILNNKNLVNMREKNENIIIVKKSKIIADFNNNDDAWDFDKWQNSQSTSKKKKKTVEDPLEGPVSRRKCDRKKLNGHDCDNCEKWYQSFYPKPEEQQKRKNAISRHRSRNKERHVTQEGYWNPNFTQPLSSSSASSDED